MFRMARLEMIIIFLRQIRNQFLLNNKNVVDSYFSPWLSAAICLVFKQDKCGLSKVKVVIFISYKWFIYIIEKYYRDFLL